MTDATTPESLTRRAMLEATAAAVAISLLSPAPLTAKPLPALIAGEVLPKFLTPAEYALLDELSEMIIPTDENSPGARAAGVARYVDRRLAESLEPERQAVWKSGLEEVDGLSRELNQKTFLQATPHERFIVLTQMAAGELEPKTPLEKFFVELKAATVSAYYTSKIGIHVDQQYKGNVYQLGEYAGFDAK